LKSPQPYIEEIEVGTSLSSARDVAVDVTEVAQIVVPADVTEAAQTVVPHRRVKHRANKHNSCRRDHFFGMISKAELVMGQAVIRPSEEIRQQAGLSEEDSEVDSYEVGSAHSFGGEDMEEEATPRTPLIECNATSPPPEGEADFVEAANDTGAEEMAPRTSPTSARSEEEQTEGRQPEQVEVLEESRTLGNESVYPDNAEQSIPKGVPIVNAEEQTITEGQVNPKRGPMVNTPT